MHAADDDGITQVDTAAESSIERLLQQLGLVQFREYLRDRLSCDVPSDAERLNLAQNTDPAVMPEVHLRPRTCHCRAPVVDRPLTTEARDGDIDVLGIELPFDQARSQLRFREFPTRQQRKPGDVGPLGSVGH